MSDRDRQRSASRTRTRSSCATPASRSRPPSARRRSPPSRPPRTRLRAIQKEIEELKDRHIRKLAEFENHKKRSERERQEYFKIALAGFAHDFLPILDNFERAFAHARPEDLDERLRAGHRDHREAARRALEALRPDSHRYVRGLRPQPSRGGRDREDRRGSRRTRSSKSSRRGYFLNDRLIRPVLREGRGPHDARRRQRGAVGTEVRQAGRQRGKDPRHRPRNHQLLRVRGRGRDPAGPDEPGGEPHHALDRGFHGGRRASRRADRQAAVDHQPDEHGLRGQAPGRPQVRRRGDRSTPARFCPTRSSAPSTAT